MERFVATLRRLRTDKGEVGIIPVLAGSILFVFASVAFSGFVTTAIAAGNLAQANTDVTAYLNKQIQTFEHTPWGSLGIEDPATATQTFEGRDYPITKQVTFDPTANTFTLNIAAPRAQSPGAPAVSCTHALTTKTSDCITLAGSVVGTAEDITPAAPAGVTENTYLVQGGQDLPNQIVDPGFESGNLNGWTVAPNAGAATNVSSTDLTDGGSRAMLLTQQDTAATVSSVPVPANFGDQVKVEAWVNPQGSTGTIAVGVTTRDSAGTSFNTPVDSRAATSSGWQLVSGVVTLPPTTHDMALTFTLTGGQANTNLWLVDNVALRTQSTNELPQGDMENASWVMNPAANVAVVTTDNLDAPGRQSIQLNGGQPTVSATSTASTATSLDNTYTVDAWVRALGSASSVGSFDLHTYTTAGDVVVASQPLNALTNGWIHVVGNYVSTTAAGPFGVRTVLTGAAANTSFLVDNVTVRDAAAALGQTSGNYLQLATIDPTKLGTGTALRVSFKNLSGAAANPNLTVGLYCGTQATDAALVVSPVSITTADSGDWYWARVLMPPLDRVQNCSTPNLRVYATDGTTPSPTDIGQLSILRVLPGVSGGTDHVLPTATPTPTPGSTP